MKRALSATGSLVLCLTWMAPAAAQVADHLNCYKVKDPLAKASYTADLGGLAPAPGCLIKTPAKLLCVETTKTNVAPPPPGSAPAGSAGRFACYKVKCPKATLGAVPFTDQFGTRSLVPSAPKLLCAPEAPPTTTTTTSTTTASTTTTTLACQPGGSSCAVGTDCCSSTCGPASCQADGTSCSVAGECCAGLCTGNVCGPPACKPDAAPCTVGAECCNGYCTPGGVCSFFPPVCHPNGSTCTTSADCCSAFCTSGYCTGGVCQP